MWFAGNIIGGKQVEKVKGVIGKEWERKRNTNVSSFKNAKPVLSLIPSHPTSLANVLIPPLSKMDTGSHLHDILLEYESIYSEKQKSLSAFKEKQM